MKRIVLTVILSALFFSVSAQVKRVLFLGNSYTYVNDLPKLIRDLASSAGDSLFTDSNTPGSYTLGYSPLQHLTNSVSIGKIRKGRWDYVVLQDQSQLPAIPALRDSCMLPASVKLYDSVKRYNPCAQVLFYLTWGRRVGGVQCFVPNYCSVAFADFGQMQDSLTRSYMLAANLINQPVAPVGEAWRLVLDNTSIVLHGSDGSHPSINGSYLAACVFYSSIFKKPSSGLPFTGGLQAEVAAYLQKAADRIVFSNPALFNLWVNDVTSEFTYRMDNEMLTVDNLSANATTYLWDFGDGDSSSESEPTHVYTQSGTYRLRLQACNECECAVSYKDINVVITSTIPDDIEHYNPIVLTGPDSSGNIVFNGFTGDGVLRIYDVNGKHIKEISVKDGKATITQLPKSIYVWELLSDEKPVAKGKLRY